jgi:hypothetical protein
MDLESVLIPDRHLETKKAGILLGFPASLSAPVVEELGARCSPIGLWLRLIRRAQTYMEERTDRHQGGGIPLGFVCPGSC